MTWYVSLDEPTYEEAREAFSWDIPGDYNLARDFLQKHDRRDRVALYQAYPDGRRRGYTFEDLDRASNRLANALRGVGVDRGDRVAVVVPQKPENALAHLACWKLGAVSLPLSVLFGEESLRYRLTDSESRVVVADERVCDAVAAVAPDCPDLEVVLSVDTEPTAVDRRGDETTEWVRFDDAISDRSSTFDIVETTAETPAIVMYTSGSTGPPKGVLHTHGVWLGHCPAFYMYFERDVRGDAVYWTPADWAWIGALGDLVFPAWHYGRPVVGYPMGKFDPQTAFELLAEFDVTNAFVPPTAIRMMMSVEDPTERYDLSLRAICSGGEPLTPEILEWADEALDGTVINELYGQTEANLLVTNCREWFPARPGSMGKPVPGHEVAVVDPETGEERPRDEVGEIAVRREGDPVVFREYLGQPEKTAAATVDGWHLTGDLGVEDEEGYLWFKARDDDLIITSGYRVGPGEIERVLLEHEDVEQAGVVGVPDEMRGEIIKAFVQHASNRSDLDALGAELRDLVRSQLAKYEYPREIEFVDELPQTSTGKIRRLDLREREDASGE